MRYLMRVCEVGSSHKNPREFQWDCRGFLFAVFHTRGGCKKVAGEVIGPRVGINVWMVFLGSPSHYFGASVEFDLYP